MGDRDGVYVNVTIKGVRLINNFGAPKIADEHGVDYLLPAGTEVEFLAPADWPPQDQDVWEADDGARFVADCSHPDTLLSNSHGTVGDWQFLQQYGPVKLVLWGPGRTAVQDPG